jgi:hypothetical protein
MSDAVKYKLIKGVRAYFPAVALQWVFFDYAVSALRRFVTLSFKAE